MYMGRWRPIHIYIYLSCSYQDGQLETEVISPALETLEHTAPVGYCRSMIGSDFLYQDSDEWFHRILISKIRTQ